MHSQPRRLRQERAAPTPTWRSFVARHRTTLAGYAFALPFLVVYALFLVYPFFRGIWISTFDWNLLAVAFNPDAKQFVGFENYREMLWGRGMTWDATHLWGWRLLGLAGVAGIVWAAVRGRLKRSAAIGWGAVLILFFFVLLGLHPGDEGRWFDRRFWPIVWNTVVFVAATVPTITALALLIAVVLNRPGAWPASLRTIFFLSQVLSVTVVTLIWQLIYSPSQGILANIFRGLGLEPITWITNENLAMPAIVIATVWWSLGFAMVLFLAGLQEIPDERYEAARLDGANGWQAFRHITLPGIARTLTLVVVFEIVLHFQVFGQSHLITGGGPNDATQTLVRYIYQTAFRDSQLGYASALAVFLFLIMLFFSALQLRLNREG